MLKAFLEKVIQKNPGEGEFHQAVKEIFHSLIPFIQENPEYVRLKILQRLVEPERVIIFRVSWVDDSGDIQLNRGILVQMNSVLGPYKGGLRFHSSVNLSILKFLALEQVFKNSLTTLPLGGGKGGADFNPRGKSDNEVMRFCQGFMMELFRHIGPDTDIPEGDIGVGKREIGYLFGQYKRLKNEYTGVITGKGLDWGGSLLRAEAPGYGIVFFAESMLNRTGDSIKDKLCLVSGSGNVAQCTVEKIIRMGGKCISLSDSGGTIHDPSGIDEEKLQFIRELKNIKRGRIRDYAEKYNCTFLERKTPWSIPCDVALPCATQNEIQGKDAEELLKNGCICVCEGSEMPSTPEAVRVFQNAKIRYAPAKAANAGGVAASGLEMSQNSTRLQWQKEEVDSHLQEIMIRIHDKCVEYGREKDGFIDYVKGANIAGFIRIADAMIDQGIV